jgi:hypothetical protein
MLKTVSSITNALGALNYKGTWDANANSPALASSVGTKGDYYVVSVAGSTTLNGISNWGVGDWAAYNGSAWQRVEGGADLNGVNLSVSGTSTLSGLTASTALALDASKNVVSVTNTGTGNNVLATSPSIATPTLTGDVSMTTGNLVVGTSGKGIDFSATPGTGTSELLADYEQGTWSPTFEAESGAFGAITYNGLRGGQYIKVGNVVHIQCLMYTDSVAVGTASLEVRIGGLPFTAATSTGSTQDGFSSLAVSASIGWVVNQPTGALVRSNSTQIGLTYRVTANGGNLNMNVNEVTTGSTGNLVRIAGTYVAA